VSLSIHDLRPAVATAAVLLLIAVLCGPVTAQKEEPAPLLRASPTKVTCGEQPPETRSAIAVVELELTIQNRSPRPLLVWRQVRLAGVDVAMSRRDLAEGRLDLEIGYDFVFSLKETDRLERLKLPPREPEFQVVAALASRRLIRRITFPFAFEEGSPGLPGPGIHTLRVYLESWPASLEAANRAAASLGAKADLLTALLVSEPFEVDLRCPEVPRSR